LGFDPKLRLLVLPPEDWPEHAAIPLYGMPHHAGRETIVVGDEPAGFWQGVVGMLDGVLTPARRAEAEATYGTVDGRIDISTFADLIAVHELGHLFHVQVPFAFPRLWLVELFANFCAHAYLADGEPERLPPWTMLPERMMALPADRVRHRSLEDFERLYVSVGPENYCWYQFQTGSRRKEDLRSRGSRRPTATVQDVRGTRERINRDRRLAELLKERVHPTAARVMETWPG